MPRRCAALAALALATPALAHAQSFTVLAADGMPIAPGATSTFDSADLGPPSVFGEGFILFTFGLRGVARGPAMWLQGAGLAMLAGPSHSELPRSTTFEPEFGSGEADALAFDDRRFVLTLATHGGRRGLWRLDTMMAGAEPVPVAIDGEMAPNGNAYAAVGGALGNAGNVPFATAGSAVVYRARDSGVERLWFEDFEDRALPAVIASQSGSAPGLTLGTFSSFERVEHTGPGVVFYAVAEDMGSTLGGIWSTRGGALEALALPEAEAEGNIADVGRIMTANNAGAVAFSGSRYARDMSGDLYGQVSIFHAAPFASPVALPDPIRAPDILNSVERLALSDDDRLVAVVTYFDASANDQVRSALALGGAWGLEVLLEQGDEAPGGGTITGFGDIAMNDRGGLAVELLVDRGQGGQQGVFFAETASITATFEPLAVPGQAVMVADTPQTISAAGLYGFSRVNRPYGRRQLCVAFAFDGDRKRGIGCAGLEVVPPPPPPEKTASDLGLVEAVTDPTLVDVVNLGPEDAEGVRVTFSGGERPVSAEWVSTSTQAYDLGRCNQDVDRDQLTCTFEALSVDEKVRFLWARRQTITVKVGHVDLSRFEDPNPANDALTLMMPIIPGVESKGGCQTGVAQAGLPLGVVLVLIGLAWARRRSARG